MAHDFVYNVNLLCLEWECACEEKIIGFAEAYKCNYKKERFFMLSVIIILCYTD